MANPAPCKKAHSPKDVIRDVLKGLRHSIALARTAGLAKSQIIVDPGIGFGKNYAQNLELLHRLPELSRLGHPLLVGTSRKSFIAHILRTQSQQDSESDDRTWGTAATAAASILQGAHIVRVHDIAEMVQIARVTDAILSQGQR